MNDIEIFLSKLKRDKARGALAPHQIILLISFYHLFTKQNKNTFKINEINDEFQKNWDQYQNYYKTTNRRLGMPLKALYNKELINLEINEEIMEFRNLDELKAKISLIILNKELLDFLKLLDSEKYLISKISS